MANCIKLKGYDKRCNKPVSGGVAELYLASYNLISNVTDSFEKFTTDASGTTVTAIGQATDKQFQKIGIIRNTVGLNDTLTKTVETNSIEYSNELTLTVSNISVESREFVQSLIDAGEIVAILKLKSGRYVVTGLSGFTEVTSITGGTGTAGADLNGYQIVISGVENQLSMLVSPDIVAGLLSTEG